MPRALLPTPLPPVSFKQLNIARARSVRAAHLATKTAKTKHTHRAHVRAAAAQAPLPGYAGVPAPAERPVRHTPAPSWLWFPAILIAGLFLYTFFSEKTAEKSKARREAGARFARRVVGTPTNTGVSPGHPGNQAHENLVDSKKTEP